MHFEILVEDQSGKKALDILVPKMIGDQHTFRVLPYKGIGKLPTNLHHTPDPSKRILLTQLPRLLRGYGKTFSATPERYQAIVIVVCDLDDKCLKTFRRELLDTLDTCHPRPKALFCIAIEEGEAWLLGDKKAVLMAYPLAKEAILSTYDNDSICGTWERLADAVYPGGYQKLMDKGWQSVGMEKSKWAQAIAVHMDVMNNDSPSFRYFRDKLQNLARHTNT